VKLRRLLKPGARFIQSHALSFFHLKQKPRFLLGLGTATPPSATSFGLNSSADPESWLAVAFVYRQLAGLIERLGGRKITPRLAVPGRVTAALWIRRPRGDPGASCPQAFRTTNAALDRFQGVATGWPIGGGRRPRLAVSQLPCSWPGGGRWPLEHYRPAHPAPESDACPAAFVLAEALPSAADQRGAG